MAISNFQSHCPPKPRRRDLPRHFAAAFLLPLTLLISIQGNAAELLYIYSADCPACQQFDAEVLTYYKNTDEARRLPIDKIGLAAWQAGTHPKSICITKPVNVTPTFIAIENCEEQDRISGYSQEELFWMALQRIGESIAQGASSTNAHES